MRIEFSNIELDSIKNYYLIDGLSTKKIGELFNTSLTPINRVLKKEHILRKGKSNGVKINLTEEQKEKIRNLYLYDYKSAKEISAILNINASYLDKYLTTVNYRRNKSEGVSVGLVKRTGINYNEYLKNLPEYKKYRLLVVKLTNKQPIGLLKNYEKRGPSGVDGAYNLDHKYSILEGFKNNIKPEFIASLNNLVFIPWRDNVVKRTKCSISKEELINI